MPRAAVEPIRVRRHDPELGCDVRRVVGYRARCGDHWRGSSRSTIAEAYSDAIEHNRLEHAP